MLNSKFNLEESTENYQPYLFAASATPKSIQPFLLQTITSPKSILDQFLAEKCAEDHRCLLPKELADSQLINIPSTEDTISPINKVDMSGFVKEGTGVLKAIMNTQDENQDRVTVLMERIKQKDWILSEMSAVQSELYYRLQAANEQIAKNKDDNNSDLSLLEKISDLEQNSKDQKLLIETLRIKCDSMAELTEKVDAILAEKEDLEQQLHQAREALNSQANVSQKDTLVDEEETDQADTKVVEEKQPAGAREIISALEQRNSELTNLLNDLQKSRQTELEQDYAFEEKIKTLEADNAELQRKIAEKEQDQTAEDAKKRIQDLEELVEALRKPPSGKRTSSVSSSRDLMRQDKDRHNMVTGKLPSGNSLKRCVQQIMKQVRVATIPEISAKIATLQEKSQALKKLDYKEICDNRYIVQMILDSLGLDYPNDIEQLKSRIDLFKL